MCPNQQKLTGSKSQMVLKGSGNFPNCIGAFDGIIQAPPRWGSLYFNYKGSFSMVLMTLVDHQYCFTVVHMGAYGATVMVEYIPTRRLEGLGSEHNECSLGQSLRECSGKGTNASFYWGWWSFPTYPGKNVTGDQVIFNYRLSHARRIVENAFDILAARFRMYQRRIQLSPGHTQSMIQATIVLHNYLQKTCAGAANIILEGLLNSHEFMDFA